jgi:hypothetical protein
LVRAVCSFTVCVMSGSCSFPLLLSVEIN